MRSNPIESAPGMDGKREINWGFENLPEMHENFPEMHENLQRCAGRRRKDGGASAFVQHFSLRLGWR